MISRLEVLILLMNATVRVLTQPSLLLTRPVWVDLVEPQLPDQVLYCKIDTLTIDRDCSSSCAFIVGGYTSFPGVGATTDPSMAGGGPYQGQGQPFAAPAARPGK